jgi:hypothetical protein
MWIFVLEAMIALSLLLFIVWWTLGPTHKREREMLRRLAEERAAHAGDGTATEGPSSNSPTNQREPRS